MSGRGSPSSTGSGGSSWPLTDPDQAEQCFRLALAVAAGQQARSLELRAAMSLADLLEGSDRRPEAVALVGTILEGFTEGHSTADLVRARRMLDGVLTTDQA